MNELLNLRGGVGRGQENGEDDVFAMDNALREIGAYVPPPEYARAPQRYATEPMIDALEGYQEQNGLKIDGYAKPGGPTERAINNNVLGKPRGAGLLHDFAMSVGKTVGNGFDNEPRDVQTVKRALGGLGYLPEDPFDRPAGFIDETTTKAIKRFQDDNGLAADGWLGPAGETETALRQAVDRLARAKRPEWLEYRGRAPSPELLKSVGTLDDAAEAARFARQLLKGVSPDRRGTLLDLGEPGSRSNDTDMASRTAPATPSKGVAERLDETIGNSPSDPESSFGSWAIERSEVLPEGVAPPADPFKPDPLPRDMSNEMPHYGADGRIEPVDVGVSRKREVRWLISRFYRVGAQGEDGRFRLGDEEFDRYLAAAREHIKSEHYAVFELTARAVRAGALDWQTAATRLAAYYAPETTGESVVDFLLDLAPIVGQVKAAKELHGALEDAVDAAAYGDARAHDAALAAAATAMATLIMPGAPGRVLKTIAKSLKPELHHLVPIYLGGTKIGPRLLMSRAEHRAGVASLHSKMREFFQEHDRRLVSSWKNPGLGIVNQVKLQDRIDALNAFYRSLERSPIRYHREAFDAWKKIFPEVRKYIKP